METSRSSDFLKGQVRDYYHQQRLSSSQIDDLQNLTKEKHTHWSVSLGLVASGLLAGVFYWLTLTGLDYDKISTEIAYNHNSQMEMEVFSESIDVVQTHLNRLGFSLIDSEYFSADQWQLVGGRYCSIGGKIAAQLKIKNLETLKIYTFYQAMLPDQIFNTVRETDTEVDGVNVKLWQEKGLLMGLAR